MTINQLWAKKILAGTKNYSDVPAIRKTAVKAILEQKVADEEITAEQLEEILAA